MNNPQVSIIVPCFNQAQYLSEALKSVLEQTYENWECIIVNDGSPDDTKQIAQKWVEKDSRFKYIFKENGGLSSARNEGINYAKGTFILPLDA
ncbi:glycosyltransferase family 2 protein, partial [Flavobacterium sp. XS1P32]